MSYLAPRRSAPAPIALGCMNFGRRTPEAEALRVVDRALDAGVGLLDTANLYEDGASERIVGKALRGRRDRVLVASKVGAARVDGRPEGLGGARVVASCEESLRRSQLDHLDLFYLHVPDPTVPVGETLDAVGTLLAAGKVRHWGVSNHASWSVAELRAEAVARGLPGPAVAQQLFNVLVRQLELEWFAYTRRFPLHTTVYNPLAGGLLTGLHQADAAPPKSSRFGRNPMYRRRYWRASAFRAVEALRGLAAEADRSLVALAYGALFHHPGVDSVLVGPGSVAHLDEALAARELPWSDELDRRVREVYVELVGTDASYAR